MLAYPRFPTVCIVAATCALCVAIPLIAGVNQASAARRPSSHRPRATQRHHRSAPGTARVQNRRAKKGRAYSKRPTVGTIVSGTVIRRSAPKVRAKTPVTTKAAPVSTTKSSSSPGTATPASSVSVIGGNSKSDCAYASASVSSFTTFGQQVGHDFNCALVYDNGATDWAGWDDPWFITNSDPNTNWAKWATASGTHRELIISLSLFPSSLTGTDWLDSGARGAYDSYAKTLATNLVAAGLSHSVIRLAWEANDTGGQPYDLGTTDASFALWRAFWRHTALAMRSVPGAYFLFDWCVNGGWRPLPLADWYPGDDVVDIVGIDAYDGGVPAGANRWSTVYNQPDGVHDVLQFASQHRKPASIPEWGLWSGGDDPAYVNGIASVVANNKVAYQSYFYRYAAASLLSPGSDSFAAYQGHFGAGRGRVG